MNQRHVVIAAIVAAALIALVVCSEVVLPRVMARRDDERRLLLPAGASLDAFTVQARGTRMSFARTPPSGAWTLTAGDGKTLTADARAVDAVVAALRGTRIAADVAEATPSELAPRGLDPPRVVLSWTTPPGRAWTLALGNPVVGGQISAAADGRVVLVPERLLQAADHGLDHFRAKRLAGIDADQVERIDVVRRKDQVPEGSSVRIVLERSVTGDPREDAVVDWKLVEPLGVPANSVRIASLISRLASLEALGFGAEAPTAEDLASTGLAEPAATVLVSLTGGRTVSIVIGDPSPDRHAWARIDDGPVVQLREDLARDALLPDDFWRDNRVVKLPKWRIVNVRIKKGAETGIDLEIAREPGAPWRLVRPGDAAVGPSEGDQFVEALLGVQCGRFEDELAADPSRLDARWDFDAPGSLDLEALALLPDGTPRRSNCELTPFVRDRTVYFAVRTIDEMGRVEACVAETKAVDDLLDKARVLASLARPAASAPAP